MDPVQRSIITDLFGAVPEEMGHVLRRSAYSPNIKERMDASCAIFDEKGRMMAQAEHVPVHLGSMPIAVRAVLDGFEGELHPEDQIILNDPYRGGTHLPDITVIMPVFHHDRLVAFCANRAHHADVGSDQAGSLPPYSTFLEEEGMVIPPHFLVREGELNQDLITTIQEEMRNPVERLGDLRAQIGSNRRGQQKITSIIDEHGRTEFRKYAREIRSYSSELVRSSIRSIPNGTYHADGWMESTGSDPEPARIELELGVRGSEIHIDFEGTDPEVRGNANAPLPVTVSACYYVVRSLTDHEAPLNHGCYEMVEVDAPVKTLVNPTEPHAVCSGNVETSQRIVDVLFDAFRDAVPERVPAQSQGTMNNLVIGMEKDDRQKTYYETIGGGEGAYAWRDGQDGIHTHMTNTRNTPVEALEHAYPLLVKRYELRSGSGGAGRFDGGEGIVREIEFRGARGTFSVISERRSTGPAGASGGGDGKPGRNEFIPAGRQARDLGARAHGTMNRNDRIRIMTPGGGGYYERETE